MSNKEKDNLNRPPRHITGKQYCWTNPTVKKSDRGPNGRGLCRWCTAEVPPGRRSWCGQECVDQYLIRKSASYLRDAVCDRDQGICQVCGLDTLFLSRWFKRFSKKNPFIAHEYKKLYKFSHRKTFWDADHIQSVQDSGGCCGIDNCQLLCFLCHRDKTFKRLKNESIRDQHN